MLLAKATPIGNQDESQTQSEDNSRPMPPGLLYRWRSSWQAPVTMLGLLVFAGSLALGHHFFYASLRGTRTPNGFSQQLNTAYGTAMAFLVKAALVGAVASAYTQHMWFDFRAKFLTVSTIDAKFTALSSISSLLDPNFFTKSICGAIIALLCWCVMLWTMMILFSNTMTRLLPISAIVAPAALSVRLVNDQQHTTKYVPVLNLSSLPLPPVGNPIQPSLDRLGGIVSSAMHIPPIGAFIPNATYSLEFMGPSLSCSKPPDVVLKYIDKIFDSINNKSVDEPRAVYMAFTPLMRSSYSSAHWSLDNFTVFDDSKDYWTNFIDFCLKRFDTECSLVHQTLFSLPYNWVELSTNRTTDNVLWLRLSGERLVCSLQQTQYRVVFDARDSTSALKSYNFTHQGVLATPWGKRSIEFSSYALALQPLLDFLYGTTFYSISLCGLSTAPENECTSDIIYRVLQTNAHRTALAAFLGPMANDTYHRIWAAGSKTHPGEPGFMTPSTPAPQFDPLDLALARNLSVAGVIEEMSRNMTLSYFTDGKYLSFNTTVANVTIIQPVNIYAYDSRNLILAYGIAFGTSFLAILTGLYVWNSNGQVNYGATFSSILNATSRNPGLKALTEQVATASSSLVASEDMLRVKLKYGKLNEESEYNGEREEMSYSPEVEAFGEPGHVM